MLLYQAHPYYFALLCIGGVVLGILIGNYLWRD